MKGKSLTIILVLCVMAVTLGDGHHGMHGSDSGLSHGFNPVHARMGLERGLLGPPCRGDPGHGPCVSYPFFSLLICAATIFQWIGPCSREVWILLPPAMKNPRGWPGLSKTANWRIIWLTNRRSAGAFSFISLAMRPWPSGCFCSQGA